MSIKDRFIKPLEQRAKEYEAAGAQALDEGYQSLFWERRQRSEHLLAAANQIRSIDLKEQVFTIVLRYSEEGKIWIATGPYAVRVTAGYKDKAINVAKQSIIRNMYFFYLESHSEYPDVISFEVVENMPNG